MKQGTEREREREGTIEGTVQNKLKINGIKKEIFKKLSRHNGRRHFGIPNSEPRGNWDVLWLRTRVMNSREFRFYPSNSAKHAAFKLTSVLIDLSTAASQSQSINALSPCFGLGLCWDKMPFLDGNYRYFSQANIARKRLSAIWVVYWSVDLTIHCIGLTFMSHVTEEGFIRQLYLKNELSH